MYSWDKKWAGVSFSLFSTIPYVTKFHSQKIQICEDRKPRTSSTTTPPSILYPGPLESYLYTSCAVLTTTRKAVVCILLEHNRGARYTMADQLSEPKGVKRKALTRWNPFRQMLNRKKGKEQAEEAFKFLSPSESEREPHDYSTANNSCGSNSASHDSPIAVADFRYLYSGTTGSLKSSIWQGDAKSEGSDTLVEFSNDGSSACGSQSHASFTQLDVSSMEKGGSERSDDPSIDQGKRFVYRTSSARDEAGLLVMGDTPEEMEELGTEVVYFSSGSCADSHSFDDGSGIFDDDASSIFKDDADDSRNGIFLSFEALGLLHSTGSEAERRNPLDSKAWDIHKSADENEAELDDGHAFKSPEMCQPILSETERHRLDVEATLALDCEGEFKALGVRGTSEILDKKGETESLGCDGKLNTLGPLESGAAGHGKLDEKDVFGCEAEFKALGLQAVGDARYRNLHEHDGDESLAMRSVAPPIPRTIETPRRSTLDSQLSDDSAHSINDGPTYSSSVTWLSHDKLDFEDFDERPVKEITIPSPSQRESVAEPSPPSQAFRTALARTRDRLVENIKESMHHESALARTRDRFVENIKESMHMEPAVAPSIKRVVTKGVGAATSKSPLNRVGHSSNVFTNPFEVESTSGSKSSLFPRTSPPSSSERNSPPSKLYASRALDSRGKNAFSSGDSEFQKRSELSIPTPKTWPPSKLAAKYGMKSRLDLEASPDRSNDASPPRSKRSPFRKKLVSDTSAGSSNKASRTSKTYATSSDGSESSPQKSMYSSFQTKLRNSRSAETSNGSARTPDMFATSFVTTYSGASYDDVGCMFDNDGASGRSDDTEHEIVFSNGTFIQDVSSELLQSFEELAREGSAVLSGLWSTK
jgi:hypothetical protein